MDNPRRRRARPGREGWLRLTEAGRAAARDVPVGAVGDPQDGAVKQWDWPFAQAAARVLVYGTIDWIELGQIHWRVKEVSPDVPIDVVQQRALELIAELVRGGLVVVGSIDTGAYGFVAWECTVEEALSRIRAVYVDRFDDESAWEWVCLLELTRRGTVLARTIEAQRRSAERQAQTTLTAYSRCCPAKPFSSTWFPSSKEMSSPAIASRTGSLTRVWPPSACAATRAANATISGTMTCRQGRA